MVILAKSGLRPHAAPVTLPSRHSANISDTSSRVLTNLKQALKRVTHLSGMRNQHLSALEAASTLTTPNEGLSVDAFRRILVVGSAHISRPHDVVVHPTESLVFWLDEPITWPLPSSPLDQPASPGSIRLVRVGFDGLQPTVIWSGPGQANSLALDCATDGRAHRLYWINSLTMKLESVDLKGKSFLAWIIQLPDPPSLFMPDLSSSSSPAQSASAQAKKRRFTPYALDVFNGELIFSEVN
ncbi:unnamed protein product [Protopolystoma xenopodis]|uniref:Uncharacterized protein n=1 Tax=Protopolystoma xenopodis TaxID=117903 RepID=A0A3S4ZU77_9PLAT|nr:unnamed protein product [Protopolystoma xenopodis]